MPTSIKLQEEYGDDLQVVFVESQNTPPDKTEAFILGRKWMGGLAMWTTERPFESGTNGLPNYVLLSNEGEVLKKGNHVSSAVGELIDAELKRRSKGPEGTPKPLQKAWAAFYQGKIAKAIDSARKAGTKPELAEDASVLVNEFIKRTEATLKAIEWQMNNGYVSSAEDRLKDMAKACKGVEALMGTIESLSAQIDSDEMKDELAASSALDKLLSRVYADGFDKKGKAKKALERLAEKYSGTRAGDRALRISKLAPHSG